MKPLEESPRSRPGFRIWIRPNATATEAYAEASVADGPKRGDSQNDSDDSCEICGVRLVEGEETYCSAYCEADANDQRAAELGPGGDRV